MLCHGWGIRIPRLVWGFSRKERPKTNNKERVKLAFAHREPDRVPSYFVDDWCYEVPAGGTAAELRYVGRFYSSTSIANAIAYIYLATGVELGETHREPTELIEMRLVPVDEAIRMAREGEISDGPSALALLWCEPLLFLTSHASNTA